MSAVAEQSTQAQPESPRALADAMLAGEKRSARFTVHLTDSEKARLNLRASRLNMDPGRYTRNILLDFLDGKLVPAEKGTNGAA